ncbi:MAG: hypothetical protein ABI972_20935 [Acidobacteriota bacterium]
MAQEVASYREDVEQLRLRFLEYRKTHTVRSRLPEELWAAAAKLARRDGLEATAGALEVDRPSLQKWTDRFEPPAPAKPRPASFRRAAKKRVSVAPAFVELLAETTPAATRCLVEVESPKGAKLRLEWKAIRSGELVELIRAFVA